jgi:hypothetical protein
MSAAAWRLAVSSAIWSGVNLRPIAALVLWVHAQSQIARTLADFERFFKKLQNTMNCMVERGEFELPVPICEQSDDKH